MTPLAPLWFTWDGEHMRPLSPAAIMDVMAQLLGTTPAALQSERAA
jgi:hypothetical protein